MKKFTITQITPVYINPYLSNLEEFWDLSKTAGGICIGDINGDILTITGTGLSAIYAVPDATPYIEDDTDFVFHKSDGSVSTLCNGTRLVSYDFSRIMVNYLDVYPYTIQWIAILKLSSSPSTTEMNTIRDLYHLSKWWDNTLSAYGAVKGNRTIGKSTWTAETIPIPWFLTGGIAAANCIGAYRAKGAVTLAASRNNLASVLPTYDLLDGVAPDFDDTLGWGFTGTQYLRTGIIPENDHTWSAIVKFSGVTTLNGGSLLGCCNDSPYALFGIFVEYGGASTKRFCSGGFADIAGSAAQGVFAVVGTNQYINGGPQGVAFTTIAGTFNRELYIGARNYQDSADNKLGSGNIEYVAIYDVVLTGTQINAIIAAMI